MRVWIAIATLIGAVATTGMAQELEISNFRSGLDCRHTNPDAQTDLGWICFETETVQMTGQGRCVFDGRTLPCNWYGYEFDYKNAKPTDEISCVSTSSEVGTIGTPESIEASDTQTYEYRHTLHGEEGHLYNPQYSIFSTARDANFSIVDHTICSHNGNEIFQFRFEKIYPHEDEPK